MEVKLIKEIKDTTCFCMSKTFYVVFKSCGFDVKYRNNNEIYWSVNELLDPCSYLITRDENYLIIRDSVSYIRVYDLRKKELKFDIDVLTNISMPPFSFTEGIEKETIVAQIGEYQKGDTEENSKKISAYKQFSLRDGSYIKNLNIPETCDAIQLVGFANSYLLEDEKSNGNYSFYDEKDKYTQTHYMMGSFSPVVDYRNEKIILPTNFGIRILDKNLNEIDNFNLISGKMKSRSELDFLSNLRIFDLSNPTRENNPFEIDEDMDDEEIQVETINACFPLKNNMIIAAITDNERHVTYIRILDEKNGDFLLNQTIHCFTHAMLLLDDNHFIIHSRRQMFLFEIIY